MLYLYNKNSSILSKKVALLIILLLYTINDIRSLVQIDLLEISQNGVYCSTYNNAILIFVSVTTSSEITSANYYINQSPTPTPIITLNNYNNITKKQYFQYIVNLKSATFMNVSVVNGEGQINYSSINMLCFSIPTTVDWLSPLSVGSQYSNTYKSLVVLKSPNNGIPSKAFNCQSSNFICLLTQIRFSTLTPLFLIELLPLVDTDIRPPSTITIATPTSAIPIELTFSPSLSPSSVAFNLMVPSGSTLNARKDLNSRLQGFMLTKPGDNIRVYPLSESSTYVPLLGYSSSVYSMISIPYPTTTSNYQLVSLSNSKKLFNFTYYISTRPTLPMITALPSDLDIRLNRAILGATEYVYGLKLFGKYMPPYPFGIENDFNFNITFPFPPYNSMMAVSKNAFQNINFGEQIIAYTQWNQATFQIPPTRLPYIKNITFVNIDSYTVIAVISLRCENTCYKTTISDIITIPASDFANGNFQDGTFESEIKMNVVTSGQYSISEGPGAIEIYRIFDMTYASNTFYERSKYDSRNSIPLLPFFSISPLAFTSFYFEPNNIDLTYGPANTTLYFNCNVTMIQSRPRIEIIFRGYRNERESLENTFEGFCDPAINKYVIPIRLRQSLISGSVQYILHNYPLSLTSEIIASVPAVGYNAYLNVTSNYGDLMGPIVSDIKLYSSKYIPDNGLMTIIWNITISDPSGFSYGIASLKAMDSPNFFNASSFTFYQDKNQNIYNSYYQIYMEPRLPTKQSLALELHLELYDRLGNRAISFPVLKDKELSIDPFSSLVGTPKMEERIVYVNNTAMTSLGGATVSQLLIQDTPVDVSGDIRQVNITVEINIPNGFYNRATPSVHFTTFEGQIFSASLISISSTSPTITYQANVQLPYGFGVNTYLLVSIYGVQDNTGQMYGWSSETLRNLGLKYYIETTFQNVMPVILSTSELSSKGGILTIRGKKLGTIDNVLNTTVSINYKSGFVNGNVTFISGPVLLVKVDPTSEPFILIQVHSLLNSNIYTVVITEPKGPLPPLPTPSPTPSQTCPDCSGNGQCIGGTCVCNAGFSGPNCRSQIIVTNPSHDPNKPITTVSGNFDFTSGVSVVEVREVDSIGTTIKSYPLTNWTLTNNTVDNYQYYSYLTKLDNTNGSFVQVDVYFYTKVTNVKFGNKNLTMQPYTVKYSIGVSGYKFRDQLTTLQVILSTYLNSTTTVDDKCFDTQTDGNGKNEITWIKMRINDKILYGSFIDTGIIDGRETKITNSVIDNKSNTNGAPSAYYFIALNVPNFQTVALLDPDFSVLVDPDVDRCSSKSGLTTSQKIGIIIGSIAAFIVLATIVGFIIYKKMKYKIKLYLEDRKNSGVELS